MYNQKTEFRSLHHDHQLIECQLLHHLGYAAIHSLIWLKLLDLKHISLSETLFEAGGAASNSSSTSLRSYF